jgi:exodeoxyribonuclease VII small subunit
MKEKNYQQTIEKLEAIIAKIENEEIGVDALAKNVKEAVGMIKFCKDKIHKAELQVKDVVKELAEEETNP